MTKHVRNSSQWAEYLSIYGWESIKLGTFNVYLLKTFMGTVCKIQRPVKLEKEDLNRVEDLAKEKKCLFVKIEPALNQDTAIFSEFGYIPSRFPLCPPSTAYIDLSQSEHDLWKNLSSSCKYSIRRAKREGVDVEVIQDPKEEDIIRFHEESVLLGKRKKFHIQSLKDYQKKSEVFSPNVVLTNAYDGKGSLLGSKLFFGYKDTMTFMHGFTTTVGLKSKGGYLLLWESILELKRLGYKVLDLEGVDDERFPLFTKDWEGFSYFKEKFGVKVVQFPRPYIKYFSGWLKLFSKFHEPPL